MLKFFNFTACIIVAAICGAFAKGDFDQDIVRNSAEYVFWIPCALFTAIAFINLAKKDSK